MKIAVNLLFFIYLKKMRDTHILFLILLLSFIVNIEVPKFILNTDVLFYNSLLEKLNIEQANEIINIKQKWSWIVYFLYPIVTIIKFMLVTSVIFIGFSFTSIKIDFKQLWSLVIKCELIFISVPLLKVAWFIFFKTNYNLEDIQYFYPFSALNIFDHKSLEPWLIYPLQTLNLFELSYIIFLSYQISNLTKTNVDTTLKIVTSSYIPALFLWMTVVLFFTLNYS
jgi:hypothetical protein